MYINSPIDSRDAYGGLSLNLELSDSYLDSFISSGYIHGYSSHRKLISTATNCIRAERSDAVEQDIGFSGNVIDESSLILFAGASETDIKTYYDQVGIKHATQTVVANQFRISLSSVLDKSNGLLAPIQKVATASTYVLDGALLNIGVNQTVFAVFERVAAGATDLISNGSTMRCRAQTTNLQYRVNNDTSATINVTWPLSQLISICVKRIGASVELWLNNVSQGTDTLITAGAIDMSINRLFLTGTTIDWRYLEVHIFNTALDEVDRNSFNVNLDQANGI